MYVRDPIIIVNVYERIVEILWRSDFFIWLMYCALTFGVAVRDHIGEAWDGQQTHMCVCVNACLRVWCNDSFMWMQDIAYIK